VNTIKSGAVVVVMLGVLYGVFVALNKPAPAPPGGFTQQQIDQLGPPQVELSPLPLAAQEVAANPPSPAATMEAAAHREHGAAAHTARGGYGANANSVYSTPSAIEPPPSVNLPSAENTASNPYQRSAYETPVKPASEAAPHPTPESTPLHSAALTAYSFRNAWTTAEEQIAAGKLRDALAGLSPYHNHPDLSAEERAQLVAWLDALAGKVIYSTQHLLDGPYEVRGDRQTLFDIAERYRVPSDLLLNINSAVVSDPLVVVPGSVLKVVPGPFRAEVNLSTSEMTLFLNELYAGRFPFTLGNELPQIGEYKVAEKRTDRIYYGVDRTIAAGDPTNPYGNAWIDLGHEVCLHGSPATSPASGPTLGCISFSPTDARDVYGILSRGSVVSIKR